MPKDPKKMEEAEEINAYLGLILKGYTVSLEFATIRDIRGDSL